MEGKETVQTLKGIGKKQKSVARKKSDYVMNSRVSKLFCSNIMFAKYIHLYFEKCYHQIFQ